MKTKKGIFVLSLITLGIFSLTYSDLGFSNEKASSMKKGKSLKRLKKQTPVESGNNVETPINESSRDPAQRTSEVSSETYRLMEQVGRNLQNTLDEANNQ